MSFDGSGSSSSCGSRGLRSSAARADSPTLPPFSIPEGERRLFDEVAGEHDHHTTINDDEEPQVGESLQEAIETTIQSPALSEPETVLLIRSRSHSRSPSVPTEPFPNLNDSEAHPPPDEYWAQERAYDYALGKVGAEDRRYREVNDCIAALRGSLSSVEEDSTHMTVLEGVHPCPEVTHYDHFCAHHETHKQTLWTKVNNFLNSNEELPDTFRRRFLLICAMIADMEVIFFRGKEFPSDPIRLISIDELNRTLRQAREIHQEVVDVHFLINHEKENAERTRYYVAQVAAERGLTLVGRFQRMSLLITHYLKRVRHAEQSFFELLLQFYDVYFYEDFHVMYNNFRVEQSMHGVPRRLQQTSHTLTAIYQMLALMAQEYKELGEINADIGKTYLTPVLKELSDGPCICTDIFYCAPSAVEGQDPEVPPHHQHCPRNNNGEAESQRDLASSGDGSSADPQCYLTRHVFEQWLSCEVPSESRSELRRAESTQLSTPSPDHNHTQSDHVGLAGQPAIVQSTEDHDVHDQEIPSQASESVAAQVSIFKDKSVEHSQSGSLQESETEYAPAEAMSSAEFVNYYARVNHANQSSQSDLSHTSIEAQAVGYSPYDVPLPNGLPTIQQTQQLESDIYHRLGVPNTLDDSNHTLAEYHEEKSPEQSLNSEFDLLDLNSSDGDWLPYDHDADSPEEGEKSFAYHAQRRNAGMAHFDMDFTTLGNRLEQMASAYTYENNNYSHPRLPADFRFRDETPIPSTPVHYNAEIHRDYTAPNIFDNHARYRHNLETGPVFGYTEAHGSSLSSDVAHPNLPRDESGLRNGGILREDGTYSPLLPPYTEAAPEPRYVSHPADFHVPRPGRRGARYSWRR